MYKVAEALEGWGGCSGLHLPTTCERFGVDGFDFIQECVSKRRRVDVELWDMLSRGVWSHSHKFQTRGVPLVQEIEWIC